MLALGREDLKGSVFGPFAYVVKKGAGFPGFLSGGFLLYASYLEKAAEKKRKEDLKKEKFQKLFDRFSRFQKVQ
jgi:hypothetical protein